jgi:hypothetical protein
MSAFDPNAMKDLISCAVEGGMRYGWDDVPTVRYAVPFTKPTIAPDVMPIALDVMPSDYVSPTATDPRQQTQASASWFTPLRLALLGAAGYLGWKLWKGR